MITRGWNRARRASVVGVALLALLAGACGDDGDDDNAATDDTTDTAAEGEGEGEATGLPDLTGVKIRVQTGSPSPLHAVGEYMLEKLEEWGAEIDKIEFTGSSSGTQAMLADQVDLALITIDELVINATQGVETTGVAVETMGVNYAFVAKDEIQSLEDLAGKRIAMSGPGGFDVILTRMALQQAGVPTDDIEFIQLGVSGDRATALLADRVDAAMIFLSTWLDIEGEEGVHQLEEVTDAIGSLPADVWAAEPPYFEENPEVAVAVACANLEAFAWLNEGPDGYVDYVLEHVPDTEEASIAAFYEQAMAQGFWPNDVSKILLPGNLQQLADGLFESGEIEDEVDTETQIVLDRSYLEEAAERGCGA